MFNRAFNWTVCIFSYVLTAIIGLTAFTGVMHAFKGESFHWLLFLVSYAALPLTAAAYVLSVSLFKVLTKISPPEHEGNGWEDIAALVIQDLLTVTKFLESLFFTLLFGFCAFVSTMVFGCGLCSGYFHFGTVVLAITTLLWTVFLGVITRELRGKKVRGPFTW